MTHGRTAHATREPGLDAGEGSRAPVGATELRARLARRLSDLYGREVPAYRTLVEVSREVNDAVVAGDGGAERLGSLDRVTAERHGAIRVGTEAELRDVARVFAAAGMHPTGFYDLRGADVPVPVVSTAFRPHDPAELARNPFRVFTSTLVVDDERFFTRELTGQLRSFLGRRTLFAPELLELSDRAVEHGELAPADAERYLDLVVDSLALSAEPVDRAWYERLEAISPVAADIAGVGSTHINHLTPRVLDIDALYARMSERGIEMIDRIQGPPRWEGPDVLLRQTSFRALDEPRRFRETDGAVTTGHLRVRFGEVEARGVALTPAGRDRYDEMLAAVGARTAEGGTEERDVVARREWAARMPSTEEGLAAADLAYLTVAVRPDRPRDVAPPDDLAGLAAGGWVDLEPVVYEDFLPRSAAGIFASNLASRGATRVGDEAARDAGWLADAMGVEVADPYDLYAAQRDASLARAAAELGLPAVRPGARDEEPSR